MRKSVSFLFIAIFIAILSGCMISASPTNKDTIIVDPAEKKVFQINVFPSNATYTWKLDDVVVQEGTSKTYSYTPIENVVGKQTLVVEAKTLLGTDTYTWSIDTTLSPPAEPRIIDDYLRGEEPIQITTMKYEGMVILPQGLNVSPDTLSIKSGVAGVTPISKSLKSAVAGTTQNSNVGVFNTEMNTNATALMRLEDDNGEIYLMKIFPKSEDIREVNPVINTKSTAVSLIALQPGVITGVPDIDAIILELIKSLPETEALANQIDSEYSAGTFKLDGHFSNEILTRMGACFDALNKLKLDDVIPGTSGTKSLFTIPNIIMLDDSVEWDCTDDGTPVFHDSDGIDTDGVCVNATFNSIGQPSSFSMHNKLGRWAVLGVEQPGNILETLDWVSPRPFQLPSTSEILVAIGKLTYAGAKQVVYKIFNIHDNGDTFMDKLNEIIGSYFGLSFSQSTYTFASAGEYSMAVVGAHLGVSYSQYQDEIYMSIYASTLTEILIPLFSIIVDIAHEDVNKDVKDSISDPACTDAREQLLTQLPEAISDISESIAQDGTLKGTGKFLTDFVAGTLCSENGLRLAQCFLKSTIDVQKVRTYITQDFLSVFSKSVLAPYIEAYDKGVELFNLASSSLKFIYVLTSDNVSCVDTYTVDLSHVPVANAGPDKYVYIDMTVTLDGSGSTDPNNDIVSYQWKQTGGPSVTLTNANTAIAQFTASVVIGSELTFELTVTDADGLKATDTCVITISSIPDTITALLNSMVSIPDGTFQMGSENNDYGYAQYTTPVHQVTLQAFDIGAYEVTQAQYLAVMGTNPSWFQEANGYLYTENNPVETVSWYEARAFCTALSALTGRTFTLPSEAQWEYACRAGTTTLYSYGDSDALLGDYAWWLSNSGSQTHPVGTKLPNPWGLYDMMGNVWEWCLDSWHDNYIGAPNNGSAWEPETGSLRLIRGGSWGDYIPWAFRSAIRRTCGGPAYRTNYHGFRVLAVR